MLRLPDYEAEGIAEEVLTMTLSSGAELTYRLYYPEDLDLTGGDVEAPVLLLLHGAANSAEFTAATLDYAIVGKEDNLVVAAVDRHDLYDADELMEFMEYLYAQYASLDESRMYVSGFSLGAYKTCNLLSAYPDRFAAAAPLSSVGSLASGEDLLTPFFYTGGESSLLAELPSSSLAVESVFTNFIEALCERNGAQVPAASDENAWGLDFDLTETVTSSDGQHTMTKGYIYSEDGSCYTVLGSTANLGHVMISFHAEQAWAFMRQFSRNEDGSISISE